MNRWLTCMLTIPLLAGCGDDGHDHAPATAPAKPAVTVDEHDHDDNDGHDHHGHGHADEVKLAPEAIRANNIVVTTAKAMKLVGRVSAPARVAYNGEAMAHIGSAVAGRVTELNARLGDVVKKGDVLATLDSAELGEVQSDFLQKRSAVAIAQPTTRLTKSAYDRAKSLYDESKGISLTELQKREAEHAAAEGALLTAQSAEAAARNKLRLLGMADADIDTLATSGKLNAAFALRAPIAGTIIEREITLGELVGPDREALMVLADLTNLWVLADVPEAKLGEITKGAKAVVTIAGQEVAGAVTFIAHELDPATRTARVRIEVPNPNGALRPGVFARVEIDTAAADGEPVLAIPEAAVQIVEGESAVFVPVEGEPNTFAKRPVRVGPPIGGRVQVLSGLKADEKYVSTGSFILKAELGKAGAAHEH